MLIMKRPKTKVIHGLGIVIKMKCKICGAIVTHEHGNGVAYCDKCIKKLRIKHPKTYSYAYGGYIEDRR